MLWFAQRFLFGTARAPHQPFTDLDGRERAILVALVAAVFWLGLFPDEPMKKTELASRHYLQLVSTPRSGAPVASLGGASEVIDGAPAARAGAAADPGRPTADTGSAR
jgi:hypothetical protein